MLGGIKDREKFMAAFLDNANNIIETRTFSEGSIGEAVVYPRMILKAALDCDCKSIVLAHNHPGGSLNPSIQDREITERLVSIFAPLQISVIDHIIVANIQFHSMAEQGNIPSPSPKNVNYEAIPLNEINQVKEKDTNFHQPNELEVIDLDDIELLEQGDEEEEEWER